MAIYELDGQSPEFPADGLYWVADTADPGSGKSPAVDPVREALKQVLTAHPDLAAGTVGAQFHTQQGTTHAVALARLQVTSGSLLVMCAEAGPLLRPAWPASSKWDQTYYLNLQRFLDAANGGAVHWEKMEDRKPSKTGTSAAPVRLDVTNVTLCFV